MLDLIAELKASLGVPVRVDRRCPPDMAFFMHNEVVVGVITDIELVLPSSLATVPPPQDVVFLASPSSLSDDSPGAVLRERVPS